MQATPRERSARQLRGSGIVLVGLASLALIAVFVLFKVADCTGSVIDPIRAFGISAAMFALLGVILAGIGISRATRPGMPTLAWLAVLVGVIEAAGSAFLSFVALLPADGQPC